MVLLWDEGDVLGWHPNLDAGRVRRAWLAAEAFVARRCSWPADEAPDDLRQAVELLTARLLARHNSPDGLAAGGGDLGAVRVTRADSDVEALMAPFRPVVFG